MTSADDWPDWYDGAGDDEADDMDELSCGLRSDGGCDLAGTEWCDWSCPSSNDAAHNRSSRRRAPKTAPLLPLMGDDS